MQQLQPCSSAQQAVAIIRYILLLEIREGLLLVILLFVFFYRNRLLLEEGKGCFHMVSLAFFNWVNLGRVLSKIKMFLNQ